LRLPLRRYAAEFRNGDVMNRGEHVLTTDEEAAFTALVQRQSHFAFRVAYAVLLNGHDAEDAVQETFLKLYRNGGWKQAHNEQAFLARVVWRVALDRLRAAKPAESIADTKTLFDPQSTESGPEKTLVDANQHALIHAMIDALPDDLRLPLVLSASEDLNSREIGSILCIPEGTVRTRLQRARQILRERLANLNARNQETQHAG
jgi:RNA polymerase sigma-70 factor (ECF subfamily)